MNYLSVENLTKTYGEKTLFKNISFGIEQGQKVALVAKNGSGKSTLLKILVGTDIADSRLYRQHYRIIKIHAIRCIKRIYSSYGDRHTAPDDESFTTENVYTRTPG